MKILICAGIFPPEAGGPATYSKLLAEELAKRGHEVRVITYAGQKSEVGSRMSDFPIFRIVRSRFKPWHYYKYFRAVKKYGRKADVLYAQDPVSAGYPTYLAAKVLKKPYLVKITGDYSWEQAMGRKLTDALIDDFQKLPRYPGRINLMRRLQIQVCKEAHSVIVPSEYLKRLVMGWGIKEKKIHMIYNAVREVKKFDKKTAREELGIGAQNFLNLSIGRDVPWKGFDLVQEVVQDLQKIYPLIKLAILSKTDRETTDKYLNAADIFVLNTGYEGFSHTILEAMSAGLPVITTDVGGNPEIIQDGQNGLLVEYNNKDQLKEAIKKLYDDPKLREKFASNAKAGLQKFSLDNMITETEKELLKCVS
jgi:glycosyltransferase involved in cell wall biosynthesis